MLGFAALAVLSAVLLPVKSDAFGLLVVNAGQLFLTVRDMVDRVMYGYRLAWIHAGHRLPPGETP